MLIDQEMLSPARSHMIQSWPEVLKPWSLPKAAARIHALLLTAPDPLTADEIQSALDLSAGSTSTQLRQLCGAGLLEKLKILGGRTARYAAVRDPARIFSSLAAVRRDQAFSAMDALGPSVTSIADKQDLQWLEVLWQLQSLSQLMHEWLELCARRDPEWTVRTLQQLIASEIPSSKGNG